MFKRFRLKRKLLILSIPLLVVISIISLYGNNIFYYSEFKPVVEVKYTLEDQAKLKDLLNQTSSLNNVANIDRVNNTVQFQNTSLDTVKTSIQDLTSKFSGVTYSIKEVSSLRKGALTSLIIGIYLLFVGGVAAHFYFISAKGGQLKLILGGYVIFLINLSISTFISLGLLSLISRLYKITSLDLLFVMVSGLFGYILFYLASYNIQELSSFQSTGASFRVFLSKNYKKILLTTTAMVLITSIGLGINFAIHGIILVAFFLITYFQFYWHSYLTEDVHNLKSTLDYRLSVIRNLKFRRPATNLPVVERPKKKEKKKKKKKK